MKMTQRAPTNTHLIDYVKGNSLTRDRLATEMGVRKHSLQRWLDGTQSPPFWTLTFMRGLISLEGTREAIFIVKPGSKAGVVKGVLKAMSVDCIDLGRIAP